MHSYRDLDVYQKSYKAVLDIYELTQAFPKHEVFGLTNQLRRAVTSIPLCLAEGYGKREGDKELLRFIRMARGSNSEVAVLLELAKDLGYMSEDVYKEQAKRYEEIGRMLTELMKSLKASSTNNQ